MKRAIFTLLLAVLAICPALAVNISGVVKNSAGSGLEGVVQNLVIPRKDTAQEEDKIQTEYSEKRRAGREGRMAEDRRA